MSDFEIEERGGVLGNVLVSTRNGRPGPRCSGVLVYPAGVPADFVERLGRSVLNALTEKGVATDGRYVGTLGAGIIDFQLPDGRTEADAQAVVERWERESVGSGLGHPDVWPGVIVSEPLQLTTALKQRVRTVPGGRRSLLLQATARLCRPDSGSTPPVKVRRPDRPAGGAGRSRFPLLQ